MDKTTFLILTSVIDGELAASQIGDRIAAQSGSGRPPIASFYRALARAHEAGWLEIRLAEDARTPGRPPQTYLLTDAGRCELRAEAEHLKELADLVLVDPRRLRDGGR